VSSMWSDNGTNLVGAFNELRRALSQMDQTAIQRYSSGIGMQWHFNPPGASHFGGAWERMIGSVRKVLSGLLCEHGSRLSDDEFFTLLCEVEAILNSRPLTTVSGDPSDVEPLTPAHILTMKPAVLPPPGTFQDADVYSRKRWRRIQYLAQVFWSRWRREFLCLCQARSKWTNEQRNLSVDDIVLIKEDAPRSQWPLGRVLEVESGQDGLVRAAKVNTRSGSFRRPIAKLVRLFVPNGEGECRGKARV